MMIFNVVKLLYNHQLLTGDNRLANEDDEFDVGNEGTFDELLLDELDDD